MKLIFALATLLFPGLASGATVMMRFETTVNATAFGGAASTPLVVTYSFDSGLVAGTGPAELAGPIANSYGLLSSMEIKLGNETLFGTTRSGISVWNDFGNEVDYYEVQTEFPEGTVLGLGISGFRFLIADSSRTMVSDTGLPIALNVTSGPGFFQQTEFNLADDTIVEALGVVEFPNMPIGERTPFTLTVIPEPGSLAILSVAVLGGAAIRKRAGA